MALFATGKSAQACFAQLYRALGAILLTHFTRVCVGARPLEAGMHHWCLCLLFGDVWVTLEVTHGDSISELVVHMGVFEVLPGTYKYFDACILADSSQLTIPAVVNIFDGVCGAMSGDTYRLLSNNCQHAVLRTLNAMGIQGPLTEETIATVAEFYFAPLSHHLRRFDEWIRAILANACFFAGSRHDRSCAGRCAFRCSACFFAGS